MDQSADAKPSQKESPHAHLPESLRKRHEEQLRFAEEYRKTHGDPIENIAKLLKDMVGDNEELWLRIIEEP